MVKRYRIVYDRASCIGAAVCVALFPDRWDLDSEKKAILKGGKHIHEKKDWFEMIIETDKDFQLDFDSAQGCPVNAIHIYDLDTGEKLI